jgi:hypothetical protein
MEELFANIDNDNNQTFERKIINIPKLGDKLTVADKKAAYSGEIELQLLDQIFPFETSIQGSLYNDTQVLLGQCIINLRSRNMQYFGMILKL